MIPPSIPLVLFGSMTGVSVGALFLGGVVPGLLMGFAIMVVVAIVARRRNYPSEPRASFATALRGFVDGLAALVTPGIIMGGILVASSRRPRRPSSHACMRSCSA